MRRATGLVIAVCLALPAAGRGETFTFTATDNCHIGSHRAEQRMSGGNGAARGKIKGAEDYVLVNFDLSAIRGMTVSRARLRIADAGADLLRVGVSTVAAPWTGGKNSRFAKVTDAGATWLARRSPESPWAWPGSNLAHVTNGLGGSRSCIARATKAGGWYAVPVAPRVVEAAATGNQHGFCISEHDGWRRYAKWIGSQGGQVQNPRIFMRAQGGKAPVLIVEAARTDRTAPSAPSVRTVWRDNLQVGEVLLEITAGGDDGKTGRALYYHVRLDGRTVAPWMMCDPAPAGQKQLMRLAGMPPGREVRIDLTAVDEGGNRSATVTTTSLVTPKAALPAAEPHYSLGTGAPATNEAIRLWAYPDLLKAHPVTGNLLEEGGYAKAAGGAYRNGNAVWDGKRRRVSITACRDEWVAFQLAVENRRPAPLKGITVRWQGEKGIAATLYRQYYTMQKGNFYPDPLVDLALSKGAIDIPAADNAVAGQRVQSVYVDLLVDRDARVGKHAGSVVVTAPGQPALTVPVEIEVCAHQLSRKINYVVELNHYCGWSPQYAGARAGPDGTNETFRKVFYDYLAVAHQNRCTFNGVYYSHSGNISRPVPKVAEVGGRARITDWTAFDTCYGPVLDGSVFKGNHRSEQPQTHLGLCFHEGWPAHINAPGMYEHDRRKNPACEPMFSKAFESRVLSVAGDFAKHCRDKRWTKTELQLFLNNKSSYKRADGRGGICYWRLDEPVYYGDYAALAYLGGLFRRGMAARGDVPVVFRADVSYPLYQGHILDRTMDLIVLGGADENEAVVRRNADRYDGRPFRDGPQLVWEYGGLSRQDWPNVRYAAARVSSFLLGANGHIPWLCVGGTDDWHEQGKTSYSLMYNGQSRFAPVKRAGVYPSLRLKAFRRGQQDVELILAAIAKGGLSRDQFRQAIAPLANYRGSTKRAYAADAGVTRIDVDHVRLEATRQVARRMLGGPEPFTGKQTPPKAAFGAEIGTLGHTLTTTPTAGKPRTRLQKLITTRPAWADAAARIHKRFRGKPFTWACLGDSITYSKAFAVPITYQKHPDNLLFAVRQKITDSIRNRGPKYGCYSGWTSGDLLRAMPGVIRTQKPELAVVMIGTNDVGRNWNAATYEKNLRAVVKTCHAAGCVVILTTIPPRRGKMANVAQCNRVIHKLAAELKMPLIAYFETIMAESGGKWDGTFISRDGVHPNTAEPRGFYTWGSGKGGYELRNTLTAYMLTAVMKHTPLTKP